MSRRVSIAAACALVVVWGMFSTGRAAEVKESIEIGRARAIVEAEQKAILFFAHPTASYRSLRYDRAKTVDEGFTVAYTFRWHSGFSNVDHSTELTFRCGQDGTIERVEPGYTSSWFPPFRASNTVVRLIKQQVRKDPALEKDEALTKLLEGDSKSILEAYLQRDVAALGTIVRPIVAAAAAVMSDLSSVGLGTPAADAVSDMTATTTALRMRIENAKNIDAAQRRAWLDRLPNMTAAERDQIRVTLAGRPDQPKEPDQPDGLDRPKALERKPAKSPDVRIEEARALLEKNDLAGAFTRLNEVVAADPKNLAALRLRASAYEIRREWKLAADDYTRAIERDPKADDLYRYRGHCYGRMGNHLLRLSDALRSLEIAPKNPRAANGVAWLLATCPNAKLRDGVEAVRFATQACEQTDWKDAAYLDTLAAAYAEAGKFDKAAQWQRKTLADPSFSETFGEEGRSRLKLYESGKAYHEK